MVNKKWGIALACALVAGVVLGVTVFRAPPEDRVKDTLGRFVKAVMVKEGDTVLSRGGRIKSTFKEVVAEDVRVTVSEINIRSSGRQHFAEDATKAGLLYQSADCELVGMTIKIDPGGTTAKVDATAIVTGVRGGDRKVDKRPVHFLLAKDGNWRITSIDVRPAEE